ncbi:MAG: hypothetical protein JOZ52_01485 [Acidobacteria bacterium]|nr:hypothetical protein [Acidobacteriota bacterium]
MLWILSGVMLLIWIIGLLFHKGGFLHILLLFAIALIVVQFVASRRAVG